MQLVGPGPGGDVDCTIRGPRVLVAEAEGLQLFTPPNAKDDEFLAALSELKPDLMVTAAYGCFLPRRFLDIPTFDGTLSCNGFF